MFEIGVEFTLVPDPTYSPKVLPLIRKEVVIIRKEEFKLEDHIPLPPQGSREFWNLAARELGLVID